MKKQDITRGQSIFVRIMPWLCLLFLGLTWGLAFSLAKIAVDGGVKPFGITFFQSFFSGIILSVICLLRGRPIRNLLGHVPFILMIALTGVVIPGTLFYFAASHVQSGILAITVALVPLMTYGVSIPLGIERFARLRFLGLIFGLAAIALIVLPENSLPDRGALPWILLACVGSVCYTMENLILDFKPAHDLGPLRIAMGMNLIAACVTFPIAVATDSLFFPVPPFAASDYAVLGLGFISVVAYTTFVIMIVRFGSVFAAQTGYVVTLGGVLWGMVIFGEVHSYWVWLSLLLIIIGLALVRPRKASS